jgi:tetratricopeptide (TPR) repeat protein
MVRPPATHPLLGLRFFTQMRRTFACGPYAWSLLLCWLLPAAPSVQAQQTRTDHISRLVQTDGPVTDLSQVYHRFHLLLIGINKYKYNTDRRQLDYCRKDVEDLKQMLTQHYGFAGGDIVTLLDAQATRENITNALADLADPKRVSPDDCILIYWSGHGQTIKLPGGGDMGFLLPYDAAAPDADDPNNPVPYSRSCLKMEDVWNTLKLSPARHILLLVDACYSGLIAHLKAGGGGLSAATLRVWRQRSAMQVVTAGQAGETSQERAEWGHGAFTYALLEELRARSAEPGMVFTATELYGVLKPAVSNATDGKQTPTMGDHETNGDFLFIPTGQAVAPPRTIVPLPTSGSSGSISENTRNTLLDLLRHQKWSGAVAEARQALLITPSSGFLHAALGEALFMNGEKTAGANEIATGLRLDANCALAHNARGEIYSDQKRYEEAITEYNRSIQLDAMYAAPHNNLASLYSDQKRYEEAITEYNRAIKLDPGDATAYDGLGYAYYSQKRYEEAIAAYNRSIRLDPRDATAHNNLGIAYSALKRDDEAMVEYNKAIELDPKFAWPHNNLGNVYGHQKRYEQAIVEFKRAFELDPKYASPHNGLGNVYLDQKRYAEAIAEYDEAIRLDPNYERARTNRERAIKARDNVDDGFE